MVVIFVFAKKPLFNLLTDIQVQYNLNVTYRYTIMQYKALICILPAAKNCLVNFFKIRSESCRTSKTSKKISPNRTFISLSVVRCNTKTGQSQHHPGQAPVLMSIVTTMPTSLLLLMTKAGTRAAK